MTEGTALRTNYNCATKIRTPIGTTKPVFQTMLDILQTAHDQSLILCGVYLEVKRKRGRLTPAAFF